MVFNATFNNISMYRIDLAMRAIQTHNVSCDTDRH